MTYSRHSPGNWNFPHNVKPDLLLLCLMDQKKNEKIKIPTFSFLQCLTKDDQIYNKYKRKESIILEDTSNYSPSFLCCQTTTSIRRMMIDTRTPMITNRVVSYVHWHSVERNMKEHN